MEGGACFHCQKQGHWARDCPYKSPTVKTPLPDAPDVPLIQCPCDAGTCVVRTSRTPKNPGRKFYSCPARMGEACQFFKWCDMATDHGIRMSPRSPSSPPPMCPCGAGISIVSRKIAGPNAGRRLFICPVKKGQGACNFFQWEDAQVNTEVKDTTEMKQWSTQLYVGISQQDSEMEKSCSLRVGALSFQHLERLEDSPVKKYSCPSNPKTVLGTFEECNMLLIENRGHDEKSEFYSLKFHMAADVTSLEDLVHQILRLNVLGWLGRLAFPPPRCLTSPPPKPFFCCVFPSYDPIFVPLDVKSNSECPSDILRLPPGQDALILDGLLEPSGFKNSSNILSGNAVISGAILEAFQQAALHIQNELLTLLELMDPLDHESMIREANSAFSGLEQLGIGYRPFYERVKKFVGCASTLAQIESTISADLPSQKLIDSYSRQMSNYENLSRVHSKAMTVFTCSDNHRHSLQKEAIRIREVLLQIETQLSCTAVETAVLEIYLLQISQEMSESKQQLEAMYKEASQAIRLQQQREAERSSAKAALERARAELQQSRTLVPHV